MRHAQLVVARLITVVLLFQNFRVVFLVVKRPRIVRVASPAQLHRAEPPRVLQPCRSREPFVVVHRVTRVRLRIEKVQTEINYKTSKLHALSGIKQFAVRVSLKASLKRRGLQFALDKHHTTRQIAIFHRCNTADNLHTLDIVCRNAAHIHTARGMVAPGIRVARSRARSLLHQLHIGVAVNRNTIGNENRTHRTHVVVASARASLSQFYAVGISKVGQLGSSSRQKRQEIGEARRLQMLDSLAVNNR